MTAPDATPPSGGADDADAPEAADRSRAHADTVLAPPLSGDSFLSTTPEGEVAGLVAETSEGSQEMGRRGATDADELRREVGAVLRLPEGVVVDPSNIDVEQSDDDTMIINMGPQHPSTHGVLRLMFELDGETVLRTKPVIGYLHTGMEKTAEELTYVQGSTNVTRDGLPVAPPQRDGAVHGGRGAAGHRAAAPGRVDPHADDRAEPGLLPPDVDGHQRHGPRVDLDDDLRVPRARDGAGLLREDHRAADEPQLHPPGRHRRRPARRVGGRRRRSSATPSLPRTDEYDELLTGQPLFRQRTESIGRLSAEEALALQPTGPILRSTGVPWDLRRSMPYLRYDEVDFDVIVGTYGDNFDRYSVRLNEIRESIRIIRQILEKMPAGDYRVQDKKVTPPPRARIDESMEALIHHFKVFTEGFRVPEGEVYVAIESPRGELGCYLVSDGSSKPYRMHIRGPSFVNLQGLPLMMRGGLMADAVAVCSSVDPVMGEVDR